MQHPERIEPISRDAPAFAGRGLLTQSWRDLTFIHWRVEPAEVAHLLPSGIVPDVFDGTAWVGLIPFRMEDSSVLGRRPVPYFGSFTEVNVRLYGVDERGRRGVVFRSLEASRLAAVLTARAAFSLPYFWARASASEHRDEIRYRSRRLPGGASTMVVARRTAVPVRENPLADFLTARWRLFVPRRNHTVSMPNRHERWPLFEAEIVELRDELVRAAGISSVGTRAPDSVLYSPGVRAIFGAPSRID